MSVKKLQLDQEYNKYEKQIKNDIKSLPDLRKKLANDREKCLEIKKNIGKLNTEELREYHSLLDSADNLEKKIAKIETSSETINYYIKNGDILNRYYNSMEQIYNDENINRNNLLQEYLVNNDPHYMQEVKTDKYSQSEEFCKNCNVQRIVLSAESLFVCPECGEQVDSIVEYDRPSYKDPQQENVHFEYQRLNHFKDHLARIQAKESTQIPEIVFDIVRVEFAKSGRTNLAELNEQMVKSYLKKYIKLGLNKYYENVHKIIYKLTGIESVVFPIEVEHQLCNMFMKIEEPFENNRPKERRNLISYPYYSGLSRK